VLFNHLLLAMIYFIMGLGALFIGLGYIINKDNADTLLNGYNRLSKEAQAQFDLDGLLLFHKRFHLLFGTFFIGLGSVLYLLTNEEVGVLFLALAPIIAYIYYIQATKRFWPPSQFKNHKIATIVLCLTFVMLLVLFNSGGKPTSFQLEGQKLSFSGMYGEDLSADDLAYISIVDSIPPIRLKTNGYAVGNHYKGHFKLKGNQKVKLLLENNQIRPYLLLVKKNGQKIYFNSKTITAPQLADRIRTCMPMVPQQ
jgi:hypothetical protein